MQKLEREKVSHKATLIENFLDFDHPASTKEQIKKERTKYASPEEKIVLYTGNFESYQGIPLFLEASALVDEKSVVFLLVGGNPPHVEEMKKRVSELKIADRVRFTGQVSPSKVPLFIEMADVLVSPRTTGTNTPLKIYSFLKSGKPVVATNLWTHSQILNDKISVLADPDPKSFAQGILFALNDPVASERALTAKKMTDKDYTFDNYKTKITVSLEKALECKKRGSLRS
jgi:glycosyltransferase involved in cell wall biosynthesis